MPADATARSAADRALLSAMDEIDDDTTESGSTDPAGSDDADERDEESSAGATLTKREEQIAELAELRSENRQLKDRVDRLMERMDQNQRQEEESDDDFDWTLGVDLPDGHEPMAKYLDAVGKASEKRVRGLERKFGEILRRNEKRAALLETRLFMKDYNIDRTMEKKMVAFAEERGLPMVGYDNMLDVYERMVGVEALNSKQGTSAKSQKRDADGNDATVRRSRSTRRATEPIDDKSEESKERTVGGTGGKTDYVVEGFNKALRQANALRKAGRL